MDSTKIFPKSVIVNRMMVERDEIIKNDLAYGKLITN